MSEIFAIGFGADSRKFENFWIFELACGPGSRKFENSKLTDFFAKICRFLRKSAMSLRKFSDFCENLPIFAKIFENLPLLRTFAKICNFVGQ